MRRARARAIAALAIVALAAGCSDAADLTNPLDGLIISISGDRMRVEAEGGSYDFVLADDSVPVEHLRVHMRDRLPVRVTWVPRDDGLAATTIADAP